MKPVNRHLLIEVPEKEPEAENENFLTSRELQNKRNRKIHFGDN